MNQKRIVTIQDLSCFGKCSLGVALPIISTLGAEAVALPTAVLSTHTGEFKNYTFHDLTSEMTKIIEHWKELELTFDAIYIGYLGSVHQLDIVSDFLDRFVSDNTVVFIDPVMADNGKLYSGFDREFVRKMAQLCRKADIISPNLTEAAFLTGENYNPENFNEKYIKSIGEKVCSICPKAIITGVGYDREHCGAVCFDGFDMSECFKDRINGHFYGAGDIFSSVFIGMYVNTGNMTYSMQRAAEFVFESIKNTMDESDKYWYGLKFEQCLGMLCK